MKKLLEFEKNNKVKLESKKNKLGKLYSKGLLNFFGKISESEIDNIIRDVQALYEVIRGTKSWLDFTLKNNKYSFKKEGIREKILNNAVFPLLSSEVTKIWIKEHIDRNHFVVLEKSFRSLLRSILVIDIKVPEYIELSDKHKEKIKYFVKHFYKDKITERSRVYYIMLNYEQVKTESNFKIEEEYVKLANELFDFKVNIIEKEIVKNKG